MDWYFGSGIDDLVVPKDQELSDRLPSPESWSKWGIIAPEGLGSHNKCFMVDGNLSPALKFRGLFHEIETETSVHDKEQSSGSSVCGGLSEESLLVAPLSHDRPDCQLEDFAGIEQTDDIFLNSLLEDLPGYEDLYKPICFSSESQCGMTPEDNLLRDIVLDSQSISSNNHGIGSSKYLKTHAFSTSVGWEEREVSGPQFISCNSEEEDRPPVKPVRILAHLEENSSSIHVAEEQSLEESVLQDLENVMAQLTNKTRICFRDAFYRLAKNSEPHLVPQSRNDDLTMETPSSLWNLWTDHDEKTRSGRKKATESETNTIDRAIANLTFNKMGSNVGDFPVAMSVKSNQSEIGTTGPQNYSSNQQNIHHSLQPPNIACDAEVPILVQRHTHS